MEDKKRIVLAVTGASGLQYAIKTAEMLAAAECEIFCCATECAKKVAQTELEADLVEALRNAGATRVYSENDFSAPMASGSFYFDAMAVVPCSMKTLGKIANSIADNLAVRAAEVALKERRRLVVVPRETPMNSAQIKNMLELSLAGAVVLPATPAFYNKPQSVDDIVAFVAARITAAVGVRQNYLREWGV